jgi:hypothetical protein
MADKLHFIAPNIVVFNCPACGMRHRVRVNAATGKGGCGYWTWNRNMDEPTFYPTIMVYGEHHASRCHSFVRDGRIQFYADSTHALAGQTVELPDWVAGEEPEETL